jgi:hypothetical protein
MNHKNFDANELLSLLKQAVSRRVATLVSSLSSKDLCVWDGRATLIRRLPHRDAYDSVTFINENELACCGSGRYTIWNFYTNKKRMLFQDEKSDKSGTVFSPKRNLLFIKFGRFVEAWDTQTRSKLTEFETRPDGVHGYSYIGYVGIMKRINDSIMLIHCNPNLYIYNYNTMQLVKVIPPPVNARLTTHISVLREQVYVRTPAKLSRVDITTGIFTPIATTGNIFGIEMLTPKRFVTSEGLGIYVVENGKKTEIKFLTKGLLARKDDFLVYQDGECRIVLFDSNSLYDIMKFTGCVGESKIFCYY